MRQAFSLNDVFNNILPSWVVGIEVQEHQKLVKIIDQFFSAEAYNDKP